MPQLNSPNERNLVQSTGGEYTGECQTSLDANSSLCKTPLTPNASTSSHLLISSKLSTPQISSSSSFSCHNTSQLNSSSHQISSTPNASSTSLCHNALEVSAVFDDAPNHTLKNEVQDCTIVDKDKTLMDSEETVISLGTTVIKLEDLDDAHSKTLDNQCKNIAKDTEQPNRNDSKSKDGKGGN